MLERENAFYMAHQAEYQEKYLYKWLVIANESLFGIYNTPKDAIMTAQEHFKDDEFLLRRPVDDDMTLEIGPMGVVRLRRPYDTKKPRITSVITASSGELLTIPYV
ncbi:hypothetical protein [Treponema sp. R80B11-R83G3]